MCLSNATTNQIKSENKDPIDSFQLPTNIILLNQSQRAEILVTVFHSLFFYSPTFSHEQKLRIFRDLVISEYEIFERDNIQDLFTDLVLVEIINRFYTPANNSHR